MDINSRKNNNQQYDNAVYKDEWAFLNSPSEPPKQPSLFAKYKKLILFMLVPMIIITILAAIYSFTKKDSSLPLAQTNVATSQYDGQYFSMNYASSLRKDTDEKLEDGSNGWFLSFAEEDYENTKYKIFVKVSDQPPNEEASQESLNQVVDEGIELSNITSSEVSLAGDTATKYVGEYTNDIATKNVFYVTTHKNGKYLTVSGEYNKDNSDISNSLDAMLDSVKLK